MTDLVRPIVDLPTIATLESMVAHVMQDEDFLSLDYLKNRGWVAIPVESSLHFDESDVARIALAGSGAGYRECNAAPAEKLAQPEWFRVALTNGGLYALSKKVSHLK